MACGAMRGNWGGGSKRFLRTSDAQFNASYTLPLPSSKTWAEAKKPPAERFASENFHVIKNLGKFLINGRREREKKKGRKRKLFASKTKNVKQKFCVFWSTLNKSSAELKFHRTEIGSNRNEIFFFAFFSWWKWIFLLWGKVAEFEQVFVKGGTRCKLRGQEGCEHIFTERKISRYEGIK